MHSLFRSRTAVNSLVDTVNVSLLFIILFIYTTFVRIIKLIKINNKQTKIFFYLPGDEISLEQKITKFF